MQWGGWHKESRDVWKALRGKVRDACQGDHVEKMEAACLQRITPDVAAGVSGG